jgi:hypothetical protein
MHTLHNKLDKLRRNWAPTRIHRGPGNVHFLAYTFHHDVEKLAQDGEGGGSTPPPFSISTIKYKVVVYAPAERADTLPLFLLYPL